MPNVRQSPTIMSGNFEKQDRVAVIGADRDQAPLLQNLMQLYTHDFSEFWAGTSRGDLNADGLFESYPLEQYWSRPNWSALLICHTGILAGFALINDQPHSGLSAARNMGEFFILRKHRGQGVGCLAARTIFSRHRGLWELAVARKNLRALDFWRRTLQKSAEARHVQELDVQNEQWNGPILRFDWGV
jgi:predicted acetyltransferase